MSLVPPPGAEATLDGEVRRAVEPGERRFGPVCPGRISITWTSFEVDYARRPGGPGRGRARMRRRAASGAAVYDWPWRCTRVVHEYGHLAGHGHVEDPADIMHAKIERLAPECGRSRHEGAGLGRAPAADGASEAWTPVRAPVAPAASLTPLHSPALADGGHRGWPFRVVSLSDVCRRQT